VFPGQITAAGSNNDYFANDLLFSTSIPNNGKTRIKHADRNTGHAIAPFNAADYKNIWDGKFKEERRFDKGHIPVQTDIPIPANVTNAEPESRIPLKETILFPNDNVQVVIEQSSDTTTQSLGNLNEWSKDSNAETIDLSFMSYTTNPNDDTGTKRQGYFHARTNGNKRNFSGSAEEEIVDTKTGFSLRSKQTNFEQEDHENLFFSTSNSTVEQQVNHGEPIITKVSITKLSEHSKHGLYSAVITATSMLGEASPKDILVTSARNGTTAFIQSVTKEVLVNRLSEALPSVRKELINGSVDVALTSLQFIL
jgi:hypothetical protein